MIIDSWVRWLYNGRIRYYNDDKKVEIVEKSIESAM